ncbi:sugar ABC transporter substrate-binding protein [bacterium]|nr:sugar ABC transporter substrate-binding protein [bacterium]
MKKFITLFIITISILTLTACSFRRDADLKEITFWTLQMGDFSDYIYKVIRTYEKNHPNVIIKWVDVPFSEGEKRTLAAVMTDNPPDLINLNPDFSALLAQKGTLEEIEEHNVKNFNPEIIKALKYNDKLYSIPWYATSAITIYNKALFDKSGIIRLPKTYRELSFIAEKIKTSTGAYAYLPTITENDTMVKILNKYGISEIDDFNSEESIKVFNMFKELYQKGLIPQETITFTHREALEQYMAGKIVFFQGGANFLKMIEENAPSVYAQTNVCEQIKGPVGQNDFSVMNFVIPKKAKFKKEALDFCLYLTNYENQLELAKMTNIIATNTEALNDKFYSDYSDITSKARSISAKQINKITPQVKQKRNQKEINNLVNTTVQTILLNKNSVQDSLDSLVKSLKLIY